MRVFRKKKGSPNGGREQRRIRFGKRWGGGGVTEQAQAGKDVTLDGGSAILGLSWCKNRVCHWERFRKGLGPCAQNEYGKGKTAKGRTDTDSTSTPRDAALQEVEKERHERRHSNSCRFRTGERKIFGE